jgi:Leucine-rich repeat (LRR) protein
MKKLLLILLALPMIGLAQTTATDFTTNDCDGITHNLFDSLDAGNVIVIAWVMPCGGCITPSLAAYDAAQTFAISHPGIVDFYLVDDYANTSCASLVNWGNSNSMPLNTAFSSSAISMSDYGSAGMPKVVVLGGSSHSVYYNVNNNQINLNGVQTAINNALAAAVTPTWNCNNGVCSDPGDGSGQYWNQNACLANCGVPTGPTTYVPDNNFESYLEINGMGDGIWLNDSVSTANINTATYLNVNNQSIADLTGIEDFTTLTTLNCSGNQLSSLDVSQNTALTYLDCESNQLTSLDVSQNTALTNLYCTSNQFTSLDLSQNSFLAKLYCGNNQLSSLNVSGATALTTLWCWYNQLTSLDVSQNTALTELHCYSNQLSSLNVSQNTALDTLVCADNHLTSLDISQNTALTILSCDLNQLTSLNVSQNTALTNLDCHYNQLTSLNVSQNTALIRLMCDDNQLTSLDVRNGNNTNFQYFYASTNYNLYCIDVDDDAFSNFNWTSSNYFGFDSQSYFSNNCSAIYGCTDTLACNYNSLADTDDGSCVYLTTSIDNVGNHCDSYTWIDGITYTSSNNSAIHTLQTVNGCDSVFTLNLTITGNPIGQISQFGVTLQVAAFSGVGPYTYTWNTSASTQTITPTANGTYWCVITDANGCVSDTSYYNYSTTAINEINTTKQLLRITDLLGQETPYRKNTPLFYIYNDGTVEKKVVIE